MIYLLLVSLLWAFSFGLIKGVLTGVDSFFVSFIRLFLPLLLFAPILRLKTINRRTLVQLFFVGMLQYGLMYIAYIYSFQFLKAYEVALFTIFTPLYVALIYDIIQKRFTPRHAIAASLAIIGTAVVVWQDMERGNIWLGFFIVQLSNLAFAVGQVFYKKIMQALPQVKDREVFGVLYTGGVVLTLLGTLIFTDYKSLSVSSVQWLTLIYLGMVASGLGFFLWNVGVRKVNIGALAVFNNLKIPLAAAVSLLFFGESTDWRTLLLGGAIVLGALFYSEQRKEKPVES
jgi:carboxylate/amino acid/amine transporter